MQTIIDKNAVVLTVILSVENNTPVFPEPLPKEVLQCLYKEVAGFYDYEEKDCKCDLVVCVEMVETLKLILKNYEISFLNETKIYYATGLK